MFRRQGGKTLQHSKFKKISSFWPTLTPSQPKPCLLNFSTDMIGGWLVPSGGRFIGCGIGQLLFNVVDSLRFAGRGGRFCARLLRLQRQAGLPLTTSVTVFIAGRRAFLVFIFIDRPILRQIIVIITGILVYIDFLYLNLSGRGSAILPRPGAHWLGLAGPCRLFSFSVLFGWVTFG